MEREVKAEVIIIRQVCERNNCGGEMVRGGSIDFLTDPPQYPHVCGKCGFTQNFQNSYPMTKFRQLEEDSE